MFLSYGDFNINKRLFSYDRDGHTILPMFTEPGTADVFCNEMNEYFNDQPNDSRLMIQICYEPKHALNLMQAIAICAPHLENIVVNPNALGACLNGSRLLEFSISVESFIDYLQNSVSESKDP